MQIKAPEGWETGIRVEFHSEQHTPCLYNGRAELMHKEAVCISGNGTVLEFDGVPNLSLSRYEYQSKGGQRAA